MYGGRTMTDLNATVTIHSAREHDYLRRARDAPLQEDAGGSEQDRHAERRNGGYLSVVRMSE